VPQPPRLTAPPRGALRAGARQHRRAARCERREDAYTVSAHKWLLAPTGAGLLYVRHAARPHITPTYLECGMQSYTACTGTTPLQTLAGLGYALQFVSALGGLPGLAAYNAQLYRVSLSWAALRAERRVALLSAPPGSGVDSALLSFSITCAGASNGAVEARLASAHGMVVKLLPDGEGGTPLVKNALRISHYVFSTRLQHGGGHGALRARARRRARRRVPRGVSTDRRPKRGSDAMGARSVRSFVHIAYAGAPPSPRAGVVYTSSNGKERKHCSEYYGRHGLVNARVLDVHFRPAGPALCCVASTRVCRYARIHSLYAMARSIAKKLFPIF
jgi:hypothetical protein